MSGTLSPNLIWASQEREQFTSATAASVSYGQESRHRKPPLLERRASSEQGLMKQGKPTIFYR